MLEFIFVGHGDFENSESHIFGQRRIRRQRDPFCGPILGIHIGWYDEVEATFLRRSKPSDHSELSHRFVEVIKVDRMGSRYSHMKQMLTISKDCAIDGWVVGFEKTSVLLRQEPKLESSGAKGFISAHCNEVSAAMSCAFKFDRSDPSSQRCKI